MRLVSAHAISGRGQPLSAINLPEDRLLHLIAAAGRRAGRRSVRNASARTVLKTASKSAKSGSASSTMQPSDSNTPRCPFTASRTRRSTGAPPRFAPPPDANALEIAVQRRRKPASRIVRSRGERVGRVLARHGAEEERDVGHRARHGPPSSRAATMSRRRPVTPAHSGRRTQPDDAIEDARRIAQRAAHVAATRRSAPSRRRQRRRRAAAAPTDRLPSGRTD